MVTQCSYCKRIYTDNGWVEPAEFKRDGEPFAPGYCPACDIETYLELANSLLIMDSPQENAIIN